MWRELTLSFAGLIAVGVATFAWIEPVRGDETAIPVLTEPIRKMDRPQDLRRDDTPALGAITWSELAFSPNGKRLAAVGEFQKSASRPPAATKGAPKGKAAPKTADRAPETTNHSYLISLWDMDTFRAHEKVAVLATRSGQVELKFTPDSKAMIARGVSESTKVNETDPLLKAEADRRLVAADRRPADPPGRGSPALIWWQGGQNAAHLDAPTDSTFFAVAPSADNQGLAIVEDRGVREWKLVTTPRSAKLQPARDVIGPKLQVFLPPAALNGNGTALVARVPGDRLEVWNLRTRQRRSVIASPPEGEPAAQPESLLVSANGARVAVVQREKSETSHVTVHDADTGARLGIVSLGAPSPSMCLAFSNDGRFLLSAAGTNGEARLWDALNGHPLAVLKTGDPHTLAVALSPDNRRAATGGDDDAIRLWDISRFLSSGGDSRALGGSEVATKEVASADAAPAAILPAFLPAPDSESLLISGPCEVVATQGGREKRQFVVRLAKDHVLWRAMPTGPATLVRAEGSKITEIKTRDGRNVWTYDPKKILFVGPKLPAAAPAAAPAPVASATPVTPEQRDVLMFLSFRRLASRAIQAARYDEDPAELLELKSVAGERCDALRSRPGTVDGLADLYATIPGLIDQLTREGNVQDNLIREYNDELKKLARERDKVAARQKVNGMLGFAKMFMGAMPVTETVDVSGRQYTIDVGMASSKLFMSGMSDMMSASLEATQQKAMLDTAGRMTNRLKRDELVKSLQAQTDAVAALRAKESAVGERLKVPNPERLADDLQAKLKEASAAKAVVQVLTRQAEQERARPGRENATTRGSLIALQSQIRVPDPVKQVELWCVQAREIAALAALVPAGQEFDVDRAELLSQGGELFLQAATLEIGGGAWAAAFNTKADEALGLLDQALRIRPGDPSGRLRDLRACALLLCGHGHEARDQALAIREICAESGRQRTHLARILCAAGEVDQALNELEAALIQLEYPDVRQIRQAGDFPHSHRRFLDLTELKIEARPSGTGLIEVVNKSRFPVTEGTITLRYTVIRQARGAPPQSIDVKVEEAVERLEPNETRLIQPRPGVAIPVDRRGHVLARVTVYSRQQGSTTVELGNPIR
jgi:WD40 repeat protein